MATRIIKGILLIGSTLALLSFTVPKGWYTGGNTPNSYDIGTVKGGGHEGKNAGTVRSVAPVKNGFGTLMQAISPDKYAGKRIRMTGYMKSKDVSEWAGFWCRADGRDMTEILAFDNMENRAVKGTTDWHKYDVVIDVPLGTSQIAFGALMAGTGQIWFDNIAFEEVNMGIPITGQGKHTLPNNPKKVWVKNTKEYTNAGFDE